MKRIIATSVCTLFLSLLGAMGYSSNSLNVLNPSSLNQSTTRVEQSVSNTENQNLPGESKSVDAYDAAQNTRSDIKEEAPVENTVTDIQNSSNTGVKGATTTMVYKNINLSKCKSTKDVVKTLQKNGFKNVTMKNVKKIKALKDILAVINKKPTTKTTTSAANNNQTSNTKPTTQTSTTKPASTTANSSYASQVLKLVNQERAKAGLKAYTTNSTIGAAADTRAKEIVKNFSHTRPDGSSFSTVLKEYNISYMAAGENIAYGQKTPQEVVTAWMNSPGHRANILNAKFGKIGIGVYQVNGTYYWTQEFTN